MGARLILAKILNAASMVAVSLYGISVSLAIAACWVPTMRQAPVGGIAIAASLAIAIPCTAIGYLVVRRGKPRPGRLTTASPGTKIVMGYFRSLSPRWRACLFSMAGFALSLALLGALQLGASFNASSIPTLAIAMLIDLAMTLQNKAVAADLRRGTGR